MAGISYENFHMRDYDSGVYLKMWRKTTHWIYVTAKVGHLSSRCSFLFFSHFFFLSSLDIPLFVYYLSLFLSLSPCNKHWIVCMFTCLRLVSIFGWLRRLFVYTKTLFLSRSPFMRYFNSIASFHYIFWLFYVCN